MKRKVFLSLLALFSIILFLFDPKFYMSSFLNGILLWANCVLPSLFPFFIFSGILTASGSILTLSNTVGKPFSRLFKLPKLGAYVFLLSIFSGYPVGARTISELHEQKLISDDEASKLCAICSTSGPIFIVGSVGGAMFSNVRFGWLLFFVHAFAALFNGLLFRRIPTQNTTTSFILNKEEPRFSDVIFRASSAIINVGAYVALFSLFNDMLAKTNILSIAISLFKSIFPFLEGTQISAFLFGIIELTRGCSEISKLGVSPVTFILTSALLGFGGISINLQCLSFLERANVKKSSYLLMKASQTIFSLVIAAIFSVFLF